MNGSAGVCGDRLGRSGTPGSVVGLQTERQASVRLEQTPAALQEWAMSLRARFGGESVAIANRTIARAVFDALIGYDHWTLSDQPAKRGEISRSVPPEHGQGRPD